MPRYLFIRRRRRGLLAMLSLTLLVAVGGAVLLSNSSQQGSPPLHPLLLCPAPLGLWQQYSPVHYGALR